MNAVAPSAPSAAPLGAGWLACVVLLAVTVAHADPPVPTPSPAGSLVPQATVPIDQGVAMRNASLRDLPDRTGRIVGELPAGTPVLLFERSRLWVRVRPLAAPADAPLAWASLLDFRFGAVPPPTAGPAPASPGGGGVFAGFSRSVSGLLAGFQGRNRYSGGDTATIGIRGLTSAELGGATPDYQGLSRMEGFAISPQDAQAYAFAGGLVPQRLAYLAAPAPASPTPPAPARRPFQ